MGLEMPKAKSGETFVGIMIKPIKAERTSTPIGFGEVNPIVSATHNPIGFGEFSPIRFAERNPIGFADAALPANGYGEMPKKEAEMETQKTQTLSCVGFPIFSDANPSTAGQQADDEIQRKREIDIGPGAFVIDPRSFAGSAINAAHPVNFQLG